MKIFDIEGDFDVGRNYVVDVITGASIVVLVNADKDKAIILKDTMNTVPMEVMIDLPNKIIYKNKHKQD